MTIISTDGDAGLQAKSPLVKKGSDQVFTLFFLITSAIATIAWFYALALGAVAATNWLF